VVVSGISWFLGAYLLPNFEIASDLSGAEAADGERDTTYYELLFVSSTTQFEIQSAVQHLAQSFDEDADFANIEIKNVSANH